MNKIRFFNAKRSFTLIELLVVIAIIGILVSITFVWIGSSKGRARDARRKADLNQIQIALEIYYDQKGHFPFCYLCNSSVPICPTGGVVWCRTDCCGGENSCWSRSHKETYFLQYLVDEEYFSVVPRDPINSGDYAYTYNNLDKTFDPDNATNEDQQFSLYAILEKERTAGDPDCFDPPLGHPFRVPADAGLLPCIYRIVVDHGD